MVEIKDETQNIVREMTVEDWLGKDNQLGLDIWHRKYQHNGETFREWVDRVSGGDKDVAKLIRERKFLFGGRVLANRGIEGSGNFYNCFSLGFVPDDYAGIMDSLKEIGITFKIQGGQGISLSKLRPKGTPIGNEYESDGILPFIEMFNCVTQGTSQGGARKGALLISLDVRHKEILDFVTLKTDLNAVTKANLSVEIDDEFMRAVEKYYRTGEVITLHEVREYSGHNVEYDIIPIEIYKKIMEIAWDYGEPGVIMSERFRNYNFMQYDDNYQIETCNPCGEQPLKARSNCNLGSLNLYEFVDNKFTENASFNFGEFERAIDVALSALDDIIDENSSRLPDELREYRENSLNWRNIGLGVFNYAHMLMALGLKYGSEEAIIFTDKLFNFMMDEAIYSNIRRGLDKGSFPMINKKAISMSEILYQHIPLTEIEAFRNCSLLSIAPTGSIATMVGGSGGAEPEFALSYTRRTDNLAESYEVESKIVKDYRKITGNLGKLPDYFITSGQIPWRDRIDTQAVIQKHIDTAISSTVNLPYEATLEEIEQLYLYAWLKGLKGVTIFRDGCKRLGILTTSDNKKDDTNSCGDCDTCNSCKQLERGVILSVSDDLVGAKRKLVTGCGSLHLEAYFDEETGEPMETFINIGSSGNCERNLQLISRLMSTALRAGVPIETIIDQCKSIKPCPSYMARSIKHGDTSKGSSCPAAIGFALEDLHKKMKYYLLDDEDCVAGSEQTSEDAVQDMFSDKNNTDTQGNSCPECGERLRNEGGCVVCPSCGYSKCD
jgi:ribonucleoside-diphosphate reductase alpha chain